MTLSTINDLTRRRRAAAVAVAMATFSAMAMRAEIATAEPTETDPVAAEALFKAGRDLIKKGDYAAGCPKFDAALALNPSAGTMLNIAKCHEHEGKVATAWEDYHRAQALNGETRGNARKKELDDIATRGINELEPRLPRLRLSIKAPPAGLSISRDGKELPQSTWSEALPADPGKHEVTARAPGHKPVSREVTLEEGKTATVEIALEAEAAAPPPKAEGGVPVWAWIAGGAGLALAGVSVYFLVDDLGAIDQLQTSCNTSWNGTYCASGYDYRADNARKNLDFGLFVGLGGAGLLALGAATYGIVTAPRKAPGSAAAGTLVVPWAAPGGGGALISGSF